MPRARHTITGFARFEATDAHQPHDRRHQDNEIPEDSHDELSPLTPIVLKIAGYDKFTRGEVVVAFSVGP